ncbi:hypothetical protein PB2503_12134 [Parvularcula bermudensis HTCC2503]|uniref:Glycosyltransferase RgtA/B/C/D-like domain-containing protein n=1 Tax=Parvularcula bermudensis (strain ATCC BAA-594 / HTCC2503 / KCTC 12087) TaxID=314260 RepID=E0TEJ7_PARBH|nr:hypothetical protein [Parvularcula bermudensis]ADM10469.1 hypothetical protein PB2503_12134 [Parvularcula bermudensis HTCC2503]
MTEMTTPPAEGRGWARALWGVAVIGMLANLLSRALVGAYIEDQAKVVVYAETWQWTYDDEMPVFQWLATALLSVTGWSVLSLDLLKYGSLAGLLSGLYVLGRRLGGTDMVGGLAVLLAFLLPTLHDELLREYPHTTALLAFVVWSTIALHILVTLPDGSARRGRQVGLLCLLWAGGVMMKHGMALVIAAQIAAVFLICRPTRRMMIILGGGALGALFICLPIYLGFLVSPETLIEETAVFRDPGRLASWERGAVDLVSSFLAEGAVLGTVLGVAWWRGPAASADLKRPLEWALIANAVLAAILAAAILILNVAVIRDRWLASTLIFFAPVAAIAIDRWLSPTGLRISMVSLLIGFAILLVGRASEPWQNGLTGKVEEENIPHRRLAKEMVAVTGTSAVVASSDPSFLATLKATDPSTTIIGPRTIHLLSEIDELWRFTYVDRRSLTLEPAFRCEPVSRLEAHLVGFPATAPPVLARLDRCQRVMPH